MIKFREYNTSMQIQNDKTVLVGKSNHINGVEKVHLQIDRELIKKYKLIVVAYSHVEREWFPTQESYEAEIEVEERASQVV